MKEEFILKLVEQFESGQSVVLHIKEGDDELLLKKEGAFPKKESTKTVFAAPGAFAMPPQVQGQAAPFAASAIEAVAAEPDAAVQVSEGRKADVREIKSPIVGTFYRSPSPDAPPYVEKGSEVKKGQPLCVLEAMKMMNTLESEFDGVIEDVLVANGELVEFDQPIFMIRVR